MDVSEIVETTLKAYLALGASGAGYVGIFIAHSEYSLERLKFSPQIPIYP